MHFHGAQCQMHRRRDVLVVVAQQHVAQHLAFALGQLVALAVHHEVVVYELFLSPSAAHGRSVEAQRQNPERVAAREERAAQHQRVLGEVALGEEGQPLTCDRMRVDDQQEHDVLKQDAGDERP